MAVGLKRGVVELADHNPEWEILAADTIKRLWCVFGSTAKDIQHVGSTAIKGIKAKPVIDIVVAVEDFAKVEALTPVLEANGFMKRNWYDDTQMIYAVGYDVPAADRVTTHFIHIVKTDSTEWCEYIDFRDYLNVNSCIAIEYEGLKIRLAAENPYDPGREMYLAGKHDFVVAKIKEARIWADFDRRFTHIIPITKGWSEDKKYRVETADGKHMLLRVSDVAEYDRKKTEYGMMERVYALAVDTPEPIEFGLCDGGKSCYSLSGWLDVEDAEKVLPLMSETEQYVLGLKAGETLKKIHTLSAPVGIACWQERYFAVIDERIEAYRREGTPFEGSDTILDYLEKNRSLLHNRPQCFLHGDYHEGNLMVGSGDELYIIDLLDEGFGNYGDPWYDFKTFGENENTYFSTGFIRGYFNGEPPQAFWDVLTYYIVTAALTSIVWMKYHKPEELPETISWNERNAQVLSEDRSPLMKWYLPDFYIQYTDGVPYKLKAPFDFSFLSKYGKVFKVFDDQDSGNICFGMDDGEQKYFVKFAGAPTERTSVSVEEAMVNLKRSVPVYKDLAHPNLIKLLDTEEIGGGFAVVFEWVDAECMHPMYPRSRERFLRMTMETRKQVFEEILAFHAHIAKQGYVAIDFYDGSIMYDFGNNRTIICDIDLYAKTPYINNMGRLWGSSRFMSPEEFQMGAVIDEITNVYTMGATAFALFGNERDRCIEKWRLSEELFAVAKRAVSDERGERQQTIEQLIMEWRAAE